MPGQLLPLRLLTTARRRATNFQSSRGISILSEFFPFRLKYLGFGRTGFLNEAQMYSSGSFRGGRGGRSNGGGGRSSEFSRSREIGRGDHSGGRGRGARFEGRGLGGRAGQAKSLIDDEAELSDWVSDLKTDSFNIGLSSDNDDDSGRGNLRDRDSGRGRDRDSGSLRGGRGGRFGGSNRGRGSESDDFDVSDRRTSRGAFGGSRRGRGSDNFERSSRGTFGGSKRGRGSESDDFDVSDRRGSRGTFGGSKRGRGSESDDFDISDRRASRGGSAPFPRGSRGSIISSGSRSRDFDNNRGSDTRLQGNDSRGVFSSMKRGGRGSDLSSSRSRGGGSEQKGRKQTPLVSDEDDDSDFGGLLSDIDSEDDSDEEDSDEDELPPKKKGQGLHNAVSSGKNSGRPSDLSSGRSRGGGILQKGKQQLLQTSDDDDENENPTSSFVDFLNDEDSEEDDDKHARVLSANDVSSLYGSTQEDRMQPTPKVASGKDDSYLSGTRFDQCAISPLSMKGIKDAGYEKMTVVQEATLPVILKGKDILAKARTGTGKTVAFLLPAIEAIVKSPPVDRDQKRSSINVLVICPTRELASQAAAEANKLLKYHPSIGVQIVIGGVRLTLEQKRIQANPCQILVATPGRLKDHIENTSGFATRLMGVKVLILDEADHLLDMGFRKDIEKIITAVPKQRQTLLFSATVPEDVRQICHIALKRDHEFINTVEEGSGETHAQVKQTHLVAPLDKQFSLLYALLKDHIADDVDFKVLVFCTTAMVTRLVADLLSELKLNVREIHSRKPQSYRTRISDEFRKSKGLILVTSDVSARGVDYPDVTLVIQLGLPSDREQYIHRLGRTGRKGKEGQGVLVLAPWEESFLSSVKDLPITKASAPLVDPDTKKKVDRALSKVEMKNKEAAYQAWLGYYNSTKVVGRDKIRLVELANEFSRSMGLDTPPSINKLILGKMGLKNVPGLRIK